MPSRPNPRSNPRSNPRLPPALQRWVAAARWLALVAFAGWGLQACQAQTSTGAADEAALLARIRGAVGEAKCSANSQCLTLPIGERPCGGPEQWLAYSSATAPVEPLKAWSAELSDAAKRRNASSGVAGNCRYTPDPGAACVAGRCVVAATGAAAAR